MSNFTLRSDHRVFLSWYLDGTLQLRGFFFAEANPELTYLPFRAGPVPPLTGFGWKHNQLFRFTQDPSGDSAMIVLYGPKTGNLEIVCGQATFCRIFTMPLLADPGAPYSVMAAIVPTHEGGHLEDLGKEYRVIQKFSGRLAIADADLLLTKLRQEDVVIRFHRP